MNDYSQKTKQKNPHSFTRCLILHILFSCLTVPNLFSSTPLPPPHRLVPEINSSSQIPNSRCLGMDLRSWESRTTAKSRTWTKLKAPNSYAFLVEMHKGADSNWQVQLMGVFIQKNHLIYWSCKSIHSTLFQRHMSKRNAIDLMFTSFLNAIALFSLQSCAFILIPFSWLLCCGLVLALSHLALDVNRWPTPLILKSFWVIRSESQWVSTLVKLTLWMMDMLMTAEVAGSLWLSWGCATQGLWAMWCVL